MNNSARGFVDAHIHLWNTSNGWYAFPTPENPFGLGITKPFPDIYDVDAYLRDAAAEAPVKAVHVSAAEARFAPAETAWITAQAQGTPLIGAIIGSLDMAASTADIESALAEQRKSPLFRGIRLLQAPDYDSAATRVVLNSLAEHDLVYDVVAHPGGGIEAAAKVAADNPRTPFVLEHTGWPLAAADADHVATWRREIEAFASVPTTCCKLSGLGMTYHRNDADAFIPYFLHCLNLFGPDRCMFASNWPVDASYGDFAELVGIFERASEGLDDAGRAAVFGGTAERIYRL